MPVNLRLPRSEACDGNHVRQRRRSTSRRRVSLRQSSLQARSSDRFCLEKDRHSEDVAENGRQAIRYRQAGNQVQTVDTINSSGGAHTAPQACQSVSMRYVFQGSTNPGNECMGLERLRGTDRRIA
jgi:hypothetical protein